MSLLLDLIETDELVHFMYDLISDESLDKIKFYLIMKLRDMNIPVLNKQIEIKAIEDKININVAPRIRTITYRVRRKKSRIFYIIF